MSRYIDADALAQQVCVKLCTASNCSNVLKIIHDVPTADVVEVVRCKDCVNGEMKDFAPAECPYYCSTSVAYHSGRFFCSMGERREQ